MSTSYQMLKIAYEANTTFDLNKRVDIQDKIVSYIKYLDHYIKEELKIKYYIRYQDDFISSR